MKKGDHQQRGGPQKETHFKGVPALLMIPDPGWIELVEAGWNVLVDADRGKIVDLALHQEPSFTKKPKGLYGEGKAGAKIAEILKTHICKR